jgi:hypothetical protein
MLADVYSCIWVYKHVGHSRVQQNINHPLLKSLAATYLYSDVSLPHAQPPQK